MLVFSNPLMLTSLQRLQSLLGADHACLSNAFIGPVNRYRDAGKNADMYERPKRSL